MPDERNYHIFYRLLAGLDKEEKNSLHLTVAEDYHYLSQGNCFTCDGMDDEKEFANIRRAMKVIISENYWHHKRELKYKQPTYRRKGRDMEGRGRVDGGLNQFVMGHGALHDLQFCIKRAS